jgi:hexokinase
MKENIMIKIKDKYNKKDLLLAVDIGGTFIKLAIITRSGLMLDR